MNFKKGEKTFYIPALALVAGGIVVADVVKNICKAVVETKKVKQH